VADAGGGAQGEVANPGEGVSEGAEVVVVRDERAEPGPVRADVGGEQVVGDAERLRGVVPWAAPLRTVLLDAARPPGEGWVNAAASSWTTPGAKTSRRNDV
jgi:hypothetical protein